MNIVDKIRKLHAALERAALPHAFGGALALAWCTERARGTIDIDVNIFVDAHRAAEVFDSLPKSVQRGEEELARCRRDGQVRLWWDETPVDIFLNTTEFHAQAAVRVVVHEFAGASIPFLACSDLSVFKAFFNRSKDWVDLEEMIAARTLDIDRTLGVLVRYLGADDERVARLRELSR